MKLKIVIPENIELKNIFGIKPDKVTPTKNPRKVKIKQKDKFKTSTVSKEISNIIMTGISLAVVTYVYMNFIDSSVFDALDNSGAASSFVGFMPVIMIGSFIVFFVLNYSKFFRGFL